MKRAIAYTFIICVSTAVVILTASDASAQVAAPGYLIKKIGCHQQPPGLSWPATCSVTVDRDLPLGDAGCQGFRRELRFEVNAPLGKENLTLLHAAFLAGKQVTFYFYPGYWCNPSQPWYMTFGFAEVGS